MGISGSYFFPLGNESGGEGMGLSLSKKSEAMEAKLERMPKISNKFNDKLLW